VLASVGSAAMPERIGWYTAARRHENLGDISPTE
jgi:hypothetical protein